jgi:hypothetical protein
VGAKRTFGKRAMPIWATSGTVSMTCNNHDPVPSIAFPKPCVLEQPPLQMSTVNECRYRRLRVSQPTEDLWGANPRAVGAHARCSGCSGLILSAKASYLETTAKLLKLLEGVSSLFSKCALKSFNNRADFDSAIRRFDPSRPSQHSKG